MQRLRIHERAGAVADVMQKSAFKDKLYESHACKKRPHKYKPWNLLLGSSTIDSTPLDPEALALDSI